MATDTTRVLRSSIEMSWASENPGIETGIAEHLEEYTEARQKWAEATTKSWLDQEKAARLRDRSYTMLGLPSVELEELTRDTESEGVYSTLAGNTHVWLPYQLGRTSLFSGSRTIGLPMSRHNEDERVKALRAGTYIDDINYSYGVGKRALKAREAERAVEAAAIKAAEAVATDESIDPAARFIWGKLLSAKKRYAQLDPEPFAKEGISLVHAAAEKLEQSDWVAAFDRTTTTVLKLGQNALRYDSPYLEIVGEAALQISTSRMESGRDWNSSWRRSLAPHYPVEEPTEVALWDSQTIRRTPAQSFPELRSLTGIASNMPPVRDEYRDVIGVDFVTDTTDNDRLDKDRRTQLALAFAELGIAHSIKSEDIHNDATLDSPERAAERDRARKFAERQSRRIRRPVGFY